MKRVLLFGAVLMAALVLHAAPTIETKGDTLVITVNANGDLANSNFTQSQRQSKNVKLITAPGVRLSSTDFTDFFGVAYTTATLPFPSITDLDMSKVVLESDDVIAHLGANSPKLNGGGTLGTLVFPESIGTTKFTFNDNKSKWTRLVFPDATTTANEGKTVITANAFTNDKHIRSLYIGTSVKQISDNAFDGCDNLSMVDFGYGIKTIDSHAFYGCKGLTSLVLPESITEIKLGAFEKCVNLAAVRLPNSLQYIRAEAFDHTALRDVVIPASVKLIERGAFGNISALRDVYVLGTETKCQNQAFLPMAHTYGNYSYSGAGAGETVLISDFTTSSGYYVQLHYPEAAYKTYVNEYTRLIGTPEYPNNTDYPTWNNKWVVDADGNKYAVKPDKYFEGRGGDYAGWWNFMLAAKMKNSYKEERLVDGKWYSVCYPFDLDAFQLKTAFGSAVEVCEFSAVTIDTDADGKKYITLKFKTPVTTMKAHHPYMIHPGLHKAEYVVIPNVSIDNDEAGYAAKLTAEAVSHEADGVTYTFVGNHTAGAKVPKYSYYYYSGNDTQWQNGFYKAMRTDVVFTPHTAVVTLSRDNGVSGSGAKSSFFEDTLSFADDNMVTAIAGVTTQGAVAGKCATAQNVYNFYGRMVRRGTVSLEGLPAGVYVVGGKKVIVK